MKLLMENWRKFIKETQLNELFVKGDGDYVIAKGSNVWLIDDYPDEEIAAEINKALEIEGEWEEVWDLKQLLDDDMRSDVLFGEKERNDLNLYTIGSFKLDPQSSILVKKVVKQLGIKNVTQQSGAGEGDDTEYTSKWAIEGEIPSTFYHGTSTAYLENIFKLGLKPGESKTNYDGIEHPDAVFFSSRFDEAQTHASHTVNKVGGDPVILELSAPNKNLLIPDYDIDVGSGDTGCYDYICQMLRNKQSLFSKMKGESFSLSKEFGIYGYSGRVPSKFITGYYILMNPEETGIDVNFASRDEYTEMTPEEAKTYVDTKNEFGYGSTEYPEFEDEEEEEY